MTAINVVLQKRHRCLHVATDAAMYSDDGTVLHFGPKAFPIPGWPAVIACRGPALATAVIGQGLGLHCRDFDDMVRRIEALLPSLVHNCEPLFGGMAYSAIQVIIAGWSKERDAPEAYLIQTDHERPDMGDELSAILERDSAYNPDAYLLLKLDEVASGPDVDLDSELAKNMGYEGLGPDDPPETVVADLRKTLEWQRRTGFERFGKTMRCVGGYGQLTTITPETIEQRIIVRWEDDQIGRTIEPQPVTDWAAWRAERAPISNVDLTGLSRLQRERMLKKARKGTLR